MTDPEPMAREHHFPPVLYNSATMVGGALAALSLGLILFLMVLEALAEEHKPYMGIIAFVILPVFLIIGLVIAFTGAWREHRRRKRGLPPTRQLPEIDLNKPQHLRAMAALLIGGSIFLGLSGFGSYKAYEYTDSNAFCGEICHKVMQPEYTAYQQSAHARVHCVSCHIGPGAQWFVRSKISGAYQVYAVLTNSYPQPIETPIKNLRPSAETCEQCHWPAKFFDEKLVTHDYYLSDEENTHMRLNLLMKIGGGNSEYGQNTGIHWHMNIENRVEYVATDERRQEIPWVRSIHPDGTVTVYRSEDSDLSDEDLANAEIRDMDCIDCHNRPSHNYHHPSDRVNRLMTTGEIDPTLPEMKMIAVEALEGEYSSTDEAMEGIRSTLLEHFENNYPEIFASRREAIDQAIENVQRIYRENYFPAMNVSWKAFPDNLGHLYSPGCFRCHDGLHQDESGNTLSRDCDTCHTLLSQEIDTRGEMVSLTGIEYRHPEDIDEEWKETSCSDCHGE